MRLAACLVVAVAFLQAWTGVGLAALADLPICIAPDTLLRLEAPLPRTAAKLRAGEPLTIVAIGSSSTAGAGASGPSLTYPSRLEAALRERWPGHAVRVVNRGASGERVPEMLARFDRDVLAQHPDLVIWQVGTNAVLRHDNIIQDESLVRQGIRRLREAGLDLLLMDLQYAPRVLAHPEYEEMLHGIAAAGQLEGVPVFHRFEIMKALAQETGGDPAFMLSGDGLHMNDWAYGCIARLLAETILRAAAPSSMVEDSQPAAHESRRQ